MNVLANPKIECTVQAPPSEVEARIRSEICGPVLFPGTSGKRFGGAIGDGSFRLVSYETLLYKVSPRIVGTYSAAVAGTVVRAEANIIASRLFGIACLLLAGLAAVGYAVSSAGHWEAVRKAFAFVIGPAFGSAAIAIVPRQMEATAALSRLRQVACGTGE